MLKFNRSRRVDRFAIKKDTKPELIFLLANYNPASTKLKRFLEQVDKSASECSGFDLLFFASCFAGYGMHRESMLTLCQFKDEVSRLHSLAKGKQQQQAHGQGRVEGSD